MVNCEQVQEQLSAYHDGMLDAATADVVRAHLATCPRCPTILADYERLDHILAQAPRVAPGPELRARIFSSPEFREIVRSQQPGAVTKTPSVPVAVSPRARLGPQAARVWLPVILLIVLLGGTTAVISKILASHATGPAYATCPTLSGGQRLAYRYGGTLYSDVAPLVCDAKAQVGLWQVSPDGRWVAYLNNRTHTLRLVRADATLDHQVTLSAGTVQALVWSPDSQRVFIAQADVGNAGGVTLSTVDTIVHQPQRVAALNAATLGSENDSSTEAVTLAGQPAISPDGQFLAVALKGVSGAYAVAFFATQAPTGALPAHIANVPSGFPIDALGWTFGNQPILTWMAGITRGNAGFGNIPHVADFPNHKVIVFGILGDVVAAALNPSSGQWAVAGANGTVTAIDAATGAQTPLAQLSGVTAFIPSPDSAQWLVTSRQALWLLDATGLTKITDKLGAPTPAWSSTSRIAFVADGKVQIVQVQSGKVTTQAADASGVGTVAGLAWSPNGGALAIWGSAGVATVAPAGQQQSFAPHLASDAPQWTA